ncbi:MAG: biotin synthase BioB [Oligoflexales bacterium]|nr:biotin synthase BioB [Oligoflexales bacterium]
MNYRNDWTIEEVKTLYHRPLMDLIFEAAKTHRIFHRTNEVQICSLISIKTGSCQEDCAYCPQAARYNTDIEAHPLMDRAEVLQIASDAKSKGASRICMGAAWRKVKDNRDFDRVLEIVKDVNDLGVEVCCTLGMLSKEQAQKLKQAGLYAYNHNLDTSRDFYKSIISTRTYDDRLQTLENVQEAGLQVCCGGILGLGEDVQDRVAFLHTLATLKQHPESVPINSLVPVAGTPLEKQARLDPMEIVRAIACARILMPRSIVRLSAGRLEMSIAEQTLCFLAGANSIFSGEKLLTTANPEFDADKSMFELLGLVAREPFDQVENSQFKDLPAANQEMFISH